MTHPPVYPVRQSIPRDISNKVYHGKFIMAILVVLIHTFNLPAYGETPRDGLYFFEILVSQNMACVAVPMFFFLSGMFFFLNVATQKDVKVEIRKRYISVVIPYLVWNGLYTFLFLGVLQLPFLNSFMQMNHPLTLENMLKGLFLFQYDYHYWYMAHLIVCILISPVLLLLLNNKKTAVITMTVLLATNVVRLTYGQAQFFNLFYYFAGAFLVKWYPDLLLHKKYSKKSSVIALILFSAISVITMLIDSGTVLQVAILPMMLCFWIFLDLLSHKKVYAFEKESFFVFSIHLAFLLVIDRVMARLGTSRLCGWIDYLATPCVCLGAIYIVYKIMTKLLPNVYCVLTGRPVNKKK